MSDETNPVQTSSTEVTTPVASVVEEVKTPIPEDTKEIEPKPKEEAAAIPEPPPPFWAKRKYISRSFGFMFHGNDIEGNFYEVENGKSDIDGLFNKQEFESMAQLMSISKWTAEQGKEFFDKTQKLLNS